MTPTPDLNLDDAAAGWALRLSTGPLSPAEEPALVAWLAADPANGSRLQSYREVYAQLATTVPAMVRDGELPDYAAPVIRPARAVFRRLATAAAIAAALTLAATWWVNRPKPFATQTAQRQSVVLADGSHVDLNARTSLDVSLRGGERVVRLDEGEAYFEVAKDKARPFLVETPAGTVRVTGTHFNVRLDDNHQVEVTLLEGSVELRSAGSGSPRLVTRLSPGQQFDSGRTAVRALSAEEIASVTAWREGRMIFASERLDVAVGRLAHYYGREITVDPGAADLELGGRFKLDDLDTFLRGIEVSLPVRILRAGDGPIRIVRR